MGKNPEAKIAQGVKISQDRRTEKEVGDSITISPEIVEVIKIITGDDLATKEEAADPAPTRLAH